MLKLQGSRYVSHIICSMAPITLSQCLPTFTIRTITSTWSAMMHKVYLAKLINDGNWEVICKALSIRPVGTNIKENGETFRYVIDSNSSEVDIFRV